MPAGPLSDNFFVESLPLSPSDFVIPEQLRKVMQPPMFEGPKVESTQFSREQYRLDLLCRDIDRLNAENALLARQLAEANQRCVRIAAETAERIAQVISATDVARQQMGEARQREQELLSQLDHANCSTQNLEGSIVRLNAEIAHIRQSLSWRITRPLRAVRRVLKI
ncbi:hypothetical protein [Caballeronia arationis]|uniref:hypothetical protein n=1 Tax=Caballeronia arationis TaxID=1777142 RepID=UPI000787651C|nr:hypothetical protein [Caballeronia arationis]